MPGENPQQLLLFLVQVFGYGMMYATAAVVGLSIIVLTILEVRFLFKLKRPSNSMSPRG